MPCLVPATCQASDGAVTGVGVFIVDPTAAGPHLDQADDDHGPARGDRRAGGRARSAPTRLLGEGADGAAVIDAITEFATTALCVLEAGACAAALELTAEYTKTRVQFDKPIATFQAVGPAGRGRLRRHRGHPAHGLAGGLPALVGSARRRRGGGRQVLGGRGRPARGARRVPPPRRRGRRPRLPACTATSS